MERHIAFPVPIPPDPPSPPDRARILEEVSHQVRTPMNGILGMTQLLLSSGLERHQRQMAQVLLGILHSAARNSAGGRLGLQVRPGEARASPAVVFDVAARPAGAPPDVDLFLPLYTEEGGAVPPPGGPGTWALPSQGVGTENGRKIQSR